MFQLKRSHHQAVYVRSIKGNHIPAVYIYLKMIMEHILASHIKVHGSYIYKTCTILKVFYAIKQSIQINLKMKVKKPSTNARAQD